METICDECAYTFDLDDAETCACGATLCPACKEGTEHLDCGLEDEQ